MLGLSVAGLAYAAVTAITVYGSGHVHRRASPTTAAFLDRLAGILLLPYLLWLGFATILLSYIWKLN